MEDHEAQFLLQVWGLVRDRRRAKGWSQEDLTGESGLHTNQVSLIEWGGVNASLLVARKIARAFGVRLTDLLAAVENKK